MDESEIEVSNVSVNAVREYETADEMLGRFRALEDISTPSGFKNRIVDIDTEDPVESEIYIGESGSESPDESPLNRIQVSANELEDDENGEDSALQQSVFARFDAQHQSEFQTLLSEIINKIDRGTIDMFWANMVLPGNIEELDVPIEEGTDRDILGIRFKDGDTNYMVQKDHQGESSLSATVYGKLEYTVKSGESAEFIQEQITECKKKIIELGE